VAGRSGKRSGGISNTLFFSFPLLDILFMATAGARMLGYMDLGLNQLFLWSFIICILIFWIVNMYTEVISILVDAEHSITDADS